jgi:hypothetical protein
MDKVTKLLEGSGIVLSERAFVPKNFVGTKAFNRVDIQGLQSKVEPIDSRFTLIQATEPVASDKCSRDEQAFLDDKTKPNQRFEPRSKGIQNVRKVRTSLHKRESVQRSREVTPQKEAHVSSSKNKSDETYDRHHREVLASGRIHNTDAGFRQQAKNLIGFMFG